MGTKVSLSVTFVFQKKLIFLEALHLKVSRVSVVTYTYSTGIGRLGIVVKVAGTVRKSGM
jgi:hypothetical protein